MFKKQKTLSVSNGMNGNRKNHRNHFTFFLLVWFIVMWSAFLYLVGPTEIIDKIGVENSYLVAFLMALFAGASSVTVVPYLAILATFAAGGLNIFLLTLVSAPALTAGDALFFYLGSKGRRFVLNGGGIEKRLEKMTKWISVSPNWAMPFFIFIYSGFTPLPLDILSASLALVKYPFKRFVLAVFAGNSVYVFLIALAAARSGEIIMSSGL